MTLAGSIRSRTDSLERLQIEERAERSAQAADPANSRAVDNTYSYV